MQSFFNQERLCIIMYLVPLLPYFRRKNANIYFQSVQRSNLSLSLNDKHFTQILTRLLIARIGLTSTCPSEVNQRFESAVHHRQGGSFGSCCEIGQGFRYCEKATIIEKNLLLFYYYLSCKVKTKVVIFCLSKTPKLYKCRDPQYACF